MSMKWERQMFYRDVGSAWHELTGAYKWRLRHWWLYKILRRPRPEPGSSSVFMAHTIDSLFSLSPHDVPFTDMVRVKLIDDPYKVTHHPPGTDLRDIVQNGLELTDEAKAQGYTWSDE
jgi:hypothetical protein